MSALERVVPGDVLCEAIGHEAGHGTQVVGPHIRSTLAGAKHVHADGTVSVSRADEADSLTPQVGDVVLVRITKVDPRTARAKLLTIGETPVRGSGFGALIRVQDVRATQIAEMYKCFRPGDVVRAQVLSLGDKRHFYLSTQQNHFGVVGAKCAVSNQPMVAASWELMRCPLTGVTEHRKVAAVEK